MVICLERGADLHTAQLMPLPLTVSCFSKIQIGFTFLVLAHPGSPRQRAVKRVCKRVCTFYLFGGAYSPNVLTLPMGLSVEADVYVWCYALLVVHAKKEEKDTLAAASTAVDRRD